MPESGEADTRFRMVHWWGCGDPDSPIGAGIIVANFKPARNDAITSSFGSKALIYSEGLSPMAQKRKMLIIADSMLRLGNSGYDGFGHDAGPLLAMPWN